MTSGPVTTPGEHWALEDMGTPSVDPGGIPYGASEGPLKDLIPVFVDVESFVSDTISLSSMTLRQYVAASRLESLAIAVGDEDPADIYFAADTEGLSEDLPILNQGTIDALKEVSQDPAYVIVAHNAAWDTRALRFFCGVPHPINTWCTMEGSMGAWPELPGGYGLANLSRVLQLPKDRRKYPVDLKELSRLRAKSIRRPVPVDDVSQDLLDCIKKIAKDAHMPLDLKTGLTTNDLDLILAFYNIRDVDSMRAIYYRQIARIAGREQEVALRTNRQRRFCFMVDPDRLENLVAQLDKNAAKAEKLAEEYITDDQRANIFNREDTADGSLKSIRYQRLKNIINLDLDPTEEFTTTSLKKLSQITLAQNPTVSALLTQTSRAGKMMSHKRRSVVFRGVDEVDVELAPFRAHTFRFSSPGTGKSLNLHNVPKHDREIAEPIRKMFRLPDHLCFVRADLANVEYRVEGWLTKCPTILSMFVASMGGDVFTDPYCASWAVMTGQTISKKHPLRQLAKSTVLGLGFLMSAAGFVKNSLLPVLADPKIDITEESLKQLCRENGWGRPEHSRGLEFIRSRTGCSETVAIVAYHIHQAFNNTHREFRMTADWLVDCVGRVGRLGAIPNARDFARRIIDVAYRSPSAPDRDRIGLEIDDDPLSQYPSIRVACGPWPRTVCWREPHSRPTTFGETGATDFRMTIRKSTGVIKPFSPNLAIENVTQAAARNGLCMGVEKLERLGFPDCLHIHDEAMLIVPRERNAVLAARQALLDTFGPGNSLPFGWATVIKPDEITVTQTLFEDEMDVAWFQDKDTGEWKGNRRWQRIEANEPDMFKDLT